MSERKDIPSNVETAALSINLPVTKRAVILPTAYLLCKLDTADKIFWRIIHQRIESVVDPLLADNQYRFWKGHPTLGANNLLINTAKEASVAIRWKGGTRKYCLVVDLDIKEWNCIMRNLKKLLHRWSAQI